MKKIFFFLISIFLLFIVSTVGYHIVSANEVVDEVKDTISLQNSKNKYFSTFGYTIDNPAIILNPYDISPLTALIMFDTDKEVSITIQVVGKDDETSFIHTFSKSKKHYIPVYGLYPGTKNKVIVSYDDIRKEYWIETEKLPDDFQLLNQNSFEKLTFINHDSYPYAVDKNGDVRWFLNRRFFGNISRLSNGHFIIGSDIILSNSYSRDLLEIDLLGKIYYQYSLDNGYYGYFIEDGTNLYVLSNHLLKIDKQSGKILDKVSLNYHFLCLGELENSNKMFLSDDIHSIVVDKNSLEVGESDYFYQCNDSFFSSDLYFEKDEYRIVDGIKFLNYYKTKVSDKNILLIGYQKINQKYLGYHIDIKRMEDYLMISGSFKKSDDVYVVLDKFLDKKVYHLNQSPFIIHQEGLHGKYSIYIKINGTLYQTNSYVTF